MAITIMSQSLCLRSAFIITDENCSGGCAQPQISKIPNPKLQHPINHQIPIPNGGHLALGFGYWNFSGAWELVIWSLCGRQRVCHLPDQFPRLAQMFFGREHVTQANP